MQADPALVCPMFMDAPSPRNWMIGGTCELDERRQTATIRSTTLLCVSANFPGE